MDLQEIALRAGKKQKVEGAKVVDIIEFIESQWGLNIKLFPVQRVILKAHYGLALDDTTPNVRISDWNRENWWSLTEAEYLRKLYDEGRCNIREVIPGVERRELILSIGRRSGKCKSADSLVVTSRGLLELRELGDVDGPEVQPLKVGVAQEKGRRSTSAYFYCNGVRETRRLLTASGFVDESTPNHRLKVLGSDGLVRWRYLRDIQVGDYVAINRSTDLWPAEEVPVPSIPGWSLPRTLDEDFGLLLGYLVGDGTWGKASYLELTALLDQVQRFSALSSKVLGHPGRMCLDSRSKAAWRWRFDQKGTGVPGLGRAVREVLDVLGFRLDSTVKTKRVPDAIRRSPRRVVAAFLRGLFETDGTVSTVGEVSFCTASRQLAREVQALLLNMGVVSKVRGKLNRTYQREYYDVVIHGARSREVFYQLVGFDSPRKQARLEEAVTAQSARQDNKSNAESIPHQREWCRRLLDSVPKLQPRAHHKQAWSRSTLRGVLGNTIKPSSVEDLTYPRLRKLLPAARQLGANPEVLAHFEHLVSLDYFFDPVVSIEEGECPTFDLNVPEGHSFVANGMTNHNTFICACIAAYEVYKLILKGCPQSHYGLPKTNNIGIISVATDKDQAGLLYNEASGHFSNCAFFKPHTANNTQSFAKFQTPYDIQKYGRYTDDPTAKASLKVSFRSCVAKGLRGAGNIVVILDELAHFNDNGQSDAKKIYGSVKPSIAAFSPKDPADSRVPIGEVEGRIISISSPLGRQGHFYNLFQMAMRGGRASEGMLCVQAPTWEVNPTVESHFLEGEFAQDPVVFRTEYGAEFLDATQGWIENAEDLFSCINPDLRPKTKGLPRVPYFMGVDIALVGDWCAVAIGHLDSEGHIVVDAMERIRAGVGPYKDLERLEFEDVADWVQSFTKKFYITKGIFDQWAGIPFEQALHRRGLSQFEKIQFTKPLTSAVFKNFKDMMYDRRLALFDWPREESEDGTVTAHCDYIAELLTLQATYHSEYVTTVEAPNTKDSWDDFSDALVRMVHLASQEIGNRKYIAGGPSQGGPRASASAVSKQYTNARRKALQQSRLGGSNVSRQRTRNQRRGR
jgi:intein/homing endonuclease